MRRTTVLALLAALLVGGWIWLFERGEPESGDGQPVFEVEPDEVLAVAIERPEEPDLRLSRQGDGFLVGEGDGAPAPADGTEADLLLQNVASLRSGRELPEVPDGDLAAFGLDPPGLTIRITTGAGSAAAGFGDETPAPGNRYLRFGDSVLVVPAFARDNFDRDAWDLRDKRVFRLETPAARGLRLTAAGETVELVREAGVWSIVRPFRFAADAYEASGLANRLLDVEMTGLAPPPAEAEEDPFGFDRPRLTAELDLAVGPEETAASRTIHFGSESGGPAGIFARVGSEPAVFVVPKSLVEELEEGVTGGLSALRSLRLFRFAAFRAIELRVGNADGETVFRRRDGAEGREWTVEAGGAETAPADSEAVDDLLYKLNSTDAEAVAAAGLPDDGARWTISVREEVEGSEDPAEAAAESVRIAVAAGGEAQALRTGDERALRLAPAAWEEITGLLAAARTPAEDP